MTLEIVVNVKISGQSHNLFEAHFSGDETKHFNFLLDGDDANVDTLTSAVQKTFLSKSKGIELTAETIIPLFTSIVAEHINELLVNWDQVTSIYNSEDGFYCEVNKSDLHSVHVHKDGTATVVKYEPASAPQTLASTFAAIEQAVTEEKEASTPGSNSSGLISFLLSEKQPRRRKNKPGRPATNKERNMGLLWIDGENTEYVRQGDIVIIREIFNLGSLIFILLVPAAYVWTWALASFSAMLLHLYHSMIVGVDQLPRWLERVQRLLHLYVWGYFWYIFYLVAQHARNDDYDLEQLRNINWWQTALDIFYFNFDWSFPMLIAVGALTIFTNNMFTPWSRIKVKAIIRQKRDNFIKRFFSAAFGKQKNADT